MRDGGSDEDRTVSQISVDPQPEGTVAVYLVETRDEEETQSLRNLFEELEPHISVAQLSRGRLVTYAVRTTDADPSVLDEIEHALKSNYQFVVMQRSFDSVIHRVIKDLCSETGTRLLPIPRCNICSKPDPFPHITITLGDEGGEPVMSRSYCRTCAASLAAGTNKDFVLSLLSADRHDFGELANSELIRSRVRSHYLRYKIRQLSNER
ncbi:MAG: hypothetical protein HYX78_11145 [Armatimonadetes bacterium]|nr:hypothetical protein [Armatimonadota bacterium]